MLKRLALVSIIALLGAACSPSAAPAPSTGATPEAAGLSLSPAWTGDESFSYDIVGVQDGAKAGTGIVKITPAADSTTIEQTYTFGEVVQHFVTRVDSKNLKPIGGEMSFTGSPNAFSLTTQYQDGKLVITAKTAEGDKNATVDVAADAVDNDSLLMILRGLPLKEGFSTSLNIAIGASAAQVKGTVNVTGKEPVTVPAGTFETYKIELDFGGQKQGAWYDVAAPHTMIQYDNGATKFVLTK